MEVSKQNSTKLCDIWEVNRICKCMLKIWGDPKIAYFVTVFISTKLCQMTKNGAGVFTSFYPPSVKARHAYGTSGIRWRRIANINRTLEIKSPVSRWHQTFQFAMASRRAALSGNTSLIATFSSLIGDLLSVVYRRHFSSCSWCTESSRL